MKKALSLALAIALSSLIVPGAEAAGTSSHKKVLVVKTSAKKAPVKKIASTRSKSLVANVTAADTTTATTDTATAPSKVDTATTVAPVDTRTVATTPTSSTQATSAGTVFTAEQLIKILELFAKLKSQESASTSVTNNILTPITVAPVIQTPLSVAPTIIAPVNSPAPITVNLKRSEDDHKDDHKDGH